MRCFSGPPALEFSQPAAASKEQRVVEKRKTNSIAPHCSMCGLVIG
jgi:hypothetical protein